MNTLSNLIIPPYKFNKLNSSLCRGSYPKPKNFKFLKRLRLTTLISLIPKEPENYLTEWCEDNDVELISFQVQKPKENIPLSFSKIGQIIQTIVDRLDGNVYIHCLDGELVTGIVCACYRKLELWSLNNCLFEFARIIGESSASDEEQYFIEKFTMTLNLNSEQFKKLFKYQSLNWQHPSIKLCFVDYNNATEVDNNDYIETDATSIGNNSNQSNSQIESNSNSNNNSNSNTLNGSINNTGAGGSDQGKFKQSLAFLALALEGAEKK